MDDPEVSEKTGRRNRRKEAPRTKKGEGYFERLAKTPEGQALLKHWRSLGPKKAGRPKGATDGFSKYRRDKMIAEATAEAKVIVKRMEEKGIVIPKDAAAREAFETVVIEMRRKDLLPKDKLAFARTVLEWSMAKPAAESTVTVKRAEDFLDEIAGDL
jgi:hypothetical protein